MHINGWDIPDNLIPEVPAEALPPPALRWRALELVRPCDVRVVILGQDPYPQPADAEACRPAKATGLAFGLPANWAGPINSSIANIAHEVWGTTEGIPAPWWTLEAWALQGVLLLNTQLSVMPEQPLSHKGRWDAAINYILRQAIRPGVVRAAFGAEARRRLEKFDGSGTFLVAVSHPCKFSAGRGSRLAPAFRESLVFGHINQLLPVRNCVKWKAIPADLNLDSSSSSGPRAS